MTESGAIFLPKGFKFSSASAGIKASGKPDLALILADSDVAAAALFSAAFGAAVDVVGRWVTGFLAVVGVWAIAAVESVVKRASEESFKIIVVSV